LQGTTREAKNQFNSVDKDKVGTISKDDLFGLYVAS